MSVSLVSGWVPVLVPTIAGAAVLGGVDWRSRRSRRAFGGAVVAAVVIALGAWWAQARWAVVPYDVDWSTYLWIGLLALSVAAPVASVTARRSERATAGEDGGAEESDTSARHRATPRRRRVWIRIVVAALAVPLALTSTAVAVNAQYGYYPTLGSLRGDSDLESQSLADFERARHAAEHRHGGAHAEQSPASGQGSWSVDPPDVTSVGQTATTGSSTTPPPPTDPATLPPGKLIQVDIPGTVSGFHARSGWVWAPPLFVAGLVAQPPVVMMLAGAPSQTSDWLRGGNAAVTAQRFADEHRGVAPMLVLPDANGSVTGDTECVDSHLGNAETYLTRDVPAFLSTTFGVDAHHWSSVGLSEGGTCSAMLALRHPDLFGAFADFSGLTSPTLTEVVNRSVTARDLFGGDVHAYDLHDPLWLLAHDPPKTVTCYWQTGAEDYRSRAAQRALAGLADAAGMRVRAVETPDQHHDFTFWSEAFAQALPLLLSVTTTARPHDR